MKLKTMALRYVRWVAISATIAGMIIPAAVASEVEGAWAVQDLILQLYSCQGSVCGRVAWTKDPHRRQTDCGRTIVWGLTPSGPETWDGGWIYDPTDGNTYRLKAALDSDGTLHARIFRGVPLLGKTEILRKVAFRSEPGWCS
ncbi:MAG: hypothetical protein QOG73_2563 [Acetobacteraceae bacterium]|nr:hypothetical protein [Acetobacteraceae bacterium]